MQYLLLSGGSTAVRSSQSGGAGFRVPWNISVFCRAADAQRPDGIGVSVAVAVVVIPATVS